MVQQSRLSPRYVQRFRADRATNSTDANGVTTASTYDDLNRFRTRTYPDTGVESMGYTFNTAALTSYTNQINNITRYFYDPLGRKTAETNANLEGIEFTYSLGSDLLTLTDGKGQITSWHYDQFGRASNKVDTLNAVMFVYTYDQNNRLTNRWTSEKGNTGYGYDAVGNLLTISYPVSPGVTMAYDMLNRMTNMVDAVGTTKRTYDPVGQLLTEDGPFDNDTITNTYVSRLRTSLYLQQPNANWTNLFGYDSIKRLTNVTSPAGGFTYKFPALPSPLVLRLSLPNTAFITNTYDGNARLRTTKLYSSGNTVIDSAAYGYDLASERTNLTRADATTVAYTYDKIGQLKVADSSDNNEDRGFTYDAAWNVNYRTNQYGVDSFVVNPLNELTNLSSAPLAYDANGNQTNDYRGWLYTYDDENRLIAWSTGGPDAYALGTTFVYDGLGRLRTRNEFLGDGAEWVLQSTVNYIYDGMRVIQERDADNAPQVSYTRGLDLSGTLEGAGGIGGLLARSHDDTCSNLLTVYITNSLNLTFFIYISNHVDADSLRPYTDATYTFSCTAGAAVTVYAYDATYHACDVSETFTPILNYHQIVLSCNDYTSSDGGDTLCGPATAGNWPTHDYYFADGNGNISSLIDGSQNVSASYKYDAFGWRFYAAGPMADANSYGFSSKEFSERSGMYYYGYRFYDPALDRWINRDPIGEPVGENLYAFVHNRPVGKFDSLGLTDAPYQTCCCRGKKISNKPIPSGLKKCTAASVSHGVDHGWLEMNGWSADFVSGPSIWHGKGDVRSPTDYAKDTDKKCEDVLIYPCSTDANKFLQAVRDIVAAEVKNPPSYNWAVYNCFIWDDSVINRALEKAGGCTTQ